MISRITFNQEVHPFRSGTVIDFHPGVNLICGDQGTGKSTLLEAVMQHDREFANHVTLDQDGRYQAFAYYNSEYHNPRTIDGGLAIGETKYSATLEMFFNEVKDKVAGSRFANSQHFMTALINAYAKIKNMSVNVIDKKLVDLDIITQSAMKSHGQALFPFLEEALKVKNGIVFLDEPETSLSIKSQRALASMLIEAGVNNQILVATHSEILVKAFDNVLSLDEPVPTIVSNETFLSKQYGFKAINT
jgi:predicted ATPase